MTKPGLNRYSSPWTDEQLAQVRRMAGEGMSSGEIAKAISRWRPGTSRSAICGVLHRLGVTSRVAMGQHAMKPRREKPKRLPQKPAPQPVKTMAKPKALLPVSAPPQPPPPADTWAPLPGAKPCSIVDLGMLACRWPAGEVKGRHVFCAGRCGEGEVYCPAHRRMAYVKVRRAA